MTTADSRSGSVVFWSRAPGSIPSSGKNFVFRNTVAGLGSWRKTKTALLQSKAAFREPVADHWPNPISPDLIDDVNTPIRDLPWPIQARKGSVQSDTKTVGQMDVEPSLWLWVQ